jgi:hypothetical protein
MFSAQHMRRPPRVVARRRVQPELSKLTLGGFGFGFGFGVGGGRVGVEVDAGGAGGGGGGGWATVFLALGLRAFGFATAAFLRCALGFFAGSGFASTVCVLTAWIWVVGGVGAVVAVPRTSGSAVASPAVADAAGTNGVALLFPERLLRSTPKPAPIATPPTATASALARFRRIQPDLVGGFMASLRPYADT